MRNLPRSESANVNTPIIQHQEDFFPRDLGVGGKDHVERDDTAVESERMIAAERRPVFANELFLNADGRCYDGFCEGGVGDVATVFFEFGQDTVGPGSVGPVAAGKRVRSYRRSS